MAYVTGWAAGVDGTKPEQVVRGTGHRVLTAARTVLAATDTETGRCRRGPGAGTSASPRAPEACLSRDAVKTASPVRKFSGAGGTIVRNVEFADP